jgi:hypothetical protein
MAAPLGEGARPAHPWRRALALGTVMLLGTACMSPSARADSGSLPVYDGTMIFPAIQSPSDPEDYSWEVELAEDQGMELVNETTIGVFYLEGHHPAFSISAEAAHDADGTSVPTSLSVAAANVFTLTVHHRAGNPAAGGAPFVYPVTAGAGFQNGSQPVVIENSPTGRGRRRRSQACVVPRLEGDSLPVARRQLRRNRCTVGTVRKARQADRRKSGKVIGQSPRPGAIRKHGAAVDLTIGK